MIDHPDPPVSRARGDDAEELSTASPFRWDQWERLTEEDQEEEGPARRFPRGRSLLVAAALPWLVLAVVLLRPSSPPEAAPTAIAGSTDSVSESLGADRGGEEVVDDAVPFDDDIGQVHGEVYELAPGITGIRFGGRISAGASDAGAVALLVAREWLEGVGTSLEVALPNAGTGAYVEHLAVESVDFPAAGTAVVSLLAVLLEVEDGAYRAARAVRLAVPVRLDTEAARPAGEPWWLPPPELAMDEPVWETIDDAELTVAAEEALVTAGYRDVTVGSVARTGESWPLRVVATATAPQEPDGTPPAPRSIWLKDLNGRLVVSGWVPPAGDPGSDTDASPQAESDRDLGGDDPLLGGER
jgi:hypothetical protein